jgi:hypothetical protein
MKTTAKTARKRPRRDRSREPAANAPDDKIEEQYRRLRQEMLLDEALKDTFPASDPISSINFTM